MRLRSVLWLNPLAPSPMWTCSPVVLVATTRNSVEIVAQATRIWVSDSGQKYNAGEITSAEFQR
jgi:hypothetical protein